MYINMCTCVHFSIERETITLIRVAAGHESPSLNLELSHTFCITYVLVTLLIKYHTLHHKRCKGLIECLN